MVEIRNKIGGERVEFHSSTRQQGVNMSCTPVMSNEVVIDGRNNDSGIDGGSKKRDFKEIQKKFNKDMEEARVEMEKNRKRSMDEVFENGEDVAEIQRSELDEAMQQEFRDEIIELEKERLVEEGGEMLKVMQMGKKEIEEKLLAEYESGEFADDVDFERDTMACYAPKKKRVKVSRVQKNICNSTYDQFIRLYPKTRQGVEKLWRGNTDKNFSNVKQGFGAVDPSFSDALPYALYRLDAASQYPNATKKMAGNTTGPSFCEDVENHLLHEVKLDLAMISALKDNDRLCEGHALTSMLKLYKIEGLSHMHTFHNNHSHNIIMTPNLLRNSNWYSATKNIGGKGFHDLDFTRTVSTITSLNDLFLMIVYMLSEGHCFAGTNNMAMRRIYKAYVADMSAHTEEELDRKYNYIRWL